MSLNVRLVEKNPDYPHLSETAIKLLTQLCFKPDELQPADLIVNLSTATHLDLPAAIVESIVNQNLCHTLLSTGGIPDYQDSFPTTFSESLLFLNALKPELKHQLTIYSEEKSRNFKENVIYGLQAIDFSKLKTVIYITKSHASGRAYLTLKKSCPNTQFLAQTYAPPYNGFRITRENWHRDERGKARVWGEYLRIKIYGSRGDIEYDEVSSLIDQISTETNG